jgi:rare lipoprotein A
MRRLLALTTTQPIPCTGLLRGLTLLLPLLLAACSSTPLHNNPPPTVATAPAASVRSSPAKPLPALPAAGSGRGGYYKDDGPGDNPPDGLMDIPDAEPRIEPYAKATNRPYAVFGKTYTPIVDDRPFKQRGIGSWYGKKFHGQKTSSGEPYDMYKMTAAHPTLPIPSYARVTNLKTGAQVIVRINDRGPFHSTRIIDLSYTAALKLGYLSSGSGELEVERLLPEEITRMAENKRNGIANTAPVAATQDEVAPVQLGTVAPPGQIAAVAMMTAAPVAASGINSGSSSKSNTALVGGFYLQFGAYAQEANANSARDKLLQSLTGVVDKVDAIDVNGLYRLYAGPYASRMAAQDAAQLVRQRSNIMPFIVER